MNRKQTAVLWIGALLILACLAFPPYEVALTHPTQNSGATAH